MAARAALLCGDSTVAIDVERALGGVEPHLMVTDPPYGVNYDPAWLGTTIIAAEQTGRACRAIEIAPAYVDVAVKRWQAFTGLEAKLDGDGRSFEEIALERAAQDRRPEPASRVWGPGWKDPASRNTVTEKPRTVREPELRLGLRSDRMTPVFLTQ